MAIHYRLQGSPLSFDQLDENFRTLHRNARLWNENTPYEKDDLILYEGRFYTATDNPTKGVPPNMDPIWEFIILVGIQGTQGLQGLQGLIGAQGVQGLQGRQGVQGIVGAQGTIGAQGVQGTQGVQGIQGLQGILGTQGLQGRQGIQGTKGTQGIQGLQGIQGIQGIQGVQGVQGLQGTQGLQGLQGTIGIQGTQGLQGRQGVQGTSGLTIQGTQGLQGLQGRQGLQGLQGRQGLQGTSGLTIQGTQGIQGLQGLQGRQGIQGASLDPSLYLATSGGTMTSTQMVHNLNAELLNGKHSWEYVPRERKVIGTSGLTGGGDLSGDVYIMHADTSSTSGTTTNNVGTVVLQNAKVILDAYGHIQNVNFTPIDLKYLYFPLSGGTISGNVNVNGTLELNGQGFVATKPKNYVRLYKYDITWIDGWIQVSTTLYPYDAKNITNVTLRAKFGWGVSYLTPILNNPSANIAKSLPYKGFHLKDTQNLLTKTTDFEYIDLWYDLVNESGVIQLFPDKFIIGENVVDNEHKGDEEHSRVMKIVFEAVYPEFTTVLGHHYYESVLDPLSFYNGLNNSFQLKYCTIRGTNLITRAYQNGAAESQYVSVPSILEVGAHWGNTNPNTYSGYRKDITPEPSIFLKNTIAAGARMNAANTLYNTTSYGYGMEFFEETNNATLNTEYPDFKTECWLCDASTDATGYIVTGIPTEFNGATYYPKFDVRLDMEPGKPIKLKRKSPNSGEEIRYIETILNANQLRVTEPFDVREEMETFYIAEAGLGTLISSNIYSWGYFQSPATMMVAAKLKKIKLNSGMCWQIVREAARSTAVLNDSTAVLGETIGSGITTKVLATGSLDLFPTQQTAEDEGKIMGLIEIGNNRLFYTHTSGNTFYTVPTQTEYTPGGPIKLIWDVFRGFGKIDVDAAVEWIRTNYWENNAYINTAADALEGLRGISPVLTLDTIYPNSPVSKKMVEDNFLKLSGGVLTGGLTVPSFNGESLTVETAGVEIIEVTNKLILKNETSNAMFTGFYQDELTTGVTTICSVSEEIYTGLFFDYVISDGANSRIGVILAVHNGIDTRFTDISSTDIGDTSGVSFTTTLNGSFINLNIHVSSGSWEIKCVVRAL